MIYTVLHKVLLIKQLLHGFLVHLVMLYVLIYPHHLDHHHPLLVEYHVVPDDQGDFQPGHEVNCCEEVCGQQGVREANYWSRLKLGFLV